MEASDQYAVNKSAVTSGQSFDHRLFAYQTSHKDFQQEIENVTPGNCMHIYSMYHVSMAN